MAKYKGMLIHFGEIWLKGRNRGSFVRQLYNNIEYTLRDEDYMELQNLRDRFFLVFDSKSDLASIESKLRKIFGINRLSPAITTENTLEGMLKGANKLLGKKDRVRIVPHRSAKSLDFDSNDIVSYFLKNSKRLKFEMDKDVDRDLYINATRDTAFLYTEKIQGAGGLPVGSSGSAVVLLSGGIDSPVASFYAMKRGLKPIYLHVHAFPSNKDPKLSKIRRLVRILDAYSNGSKTYLMPGHVFQSSALKIPRKYELVLFKLFLYRLAEQVAKKENADCLVGGESMGQVASQTVQNLTASQQGVSYFVMRPLIGFDKQEIIDVAKRIGTFDESIKSYRDVCSIAARNPATRSSPETVGKLWKNSKMDSAVKATLSKSSNA